MNVSKSEETGVAKRIATVTGTALVPGVSKNARLYTREAIAKAVARGQARIAADDMPLTMLTHHEANDSSTHIVGRITGLTLAEDGSARFTADLADSEHGRTIASLVDTRGGKPFLKGVSIRGAWVGTPRTQEQDGKQVETADDLEIDGLDFTKRPGVSGAGVDGFEPVNESAAGRASIFETVQEALVSQIVEDAAPDKAATLASRYADPGYQPDKAKRYALDTKAQSKAAWSYINMPKNAKLYTAAQLKRIKGRIKAALKKFGVEISADEHWVIDRAYLAESAELVEHYGEEYGGGQGSFCISLSNGPLNISVSSYCVDPADLDLIGRAAMGAACDALKAIDPDMDGDMDVPGADTEDTDGDMGETNAPRPESAPQPQLAEGEHVLSAAAVIEAASAPPPGETEGTQDPDAASAPVTQPAPDPVADPNTETEEPVVTEPTTPAVESAPAATAPAAPAGITLTNEQFQMLLARAAAPAAAPTESAPASPAAPAPVPQVTETEEQRIERLVAEQVAAVKTALIQDFVEEGRGPVRKGLVRPVSESGTAGDGELNEYGVPSDWPNKPLHEYSSAERAHFFGRALQDHILKDRAVY